MLSQYRLFLLKYPLSFILQRHSLSSKSTINSLTLFRPFVLYAILIFFLLQTNNAGGRVNTYNYLSCWPDITELSRLLCSSRKLFPRNTTAVYLQEYFWKHETVKYHSAISCMFNYAWKHCSRNCFPQQCFLIMASCWTRAIDNIDYKGYGSIIIYIHIHVYNMLELTCGVLYICSYMWSAVHL